MLVVTRRYIQALSGFFLVIFIFVHLLGITLALISPYEFEKYSALLHKNQFLPYLELSIVFSFIVHIYLTVDKYFINNSKGNSVSLKSKRKDLIATFSSSIQPYSGAIILLFLIVHLLQLRFPRPIENQELLHLKFILGSAENSILYAAASIFLVFHLIHGIESAHRSSGLLNSDNILSIRFIGRFTSIMIGISFFVLIFLLR